MKEAQLKETEHGLVPEGEGWYVLNTTEAVWKDSAEFGRFTQWEGKDEARFPEVGINIAEERPLKAWDFVHCPPWAKHVIVASGSEPVHRRRAARRLSTAAGRHRRSAKSRQMWFWRRRRHPPPVLIPPLDRLAELVDRVVMLLDEAPSPAPELEQAVVERPEEDVAEGHVLFVPGPAGYRLLERGGHPPAGVDVVELDEARYRVLRLGPSPLPGDRRRCAFLEQEPPGENRTPTRARGEPDRGHESGAPG